MKIKTYYLLFLMIPMLALAQDKENNSSWNSLIIDYKINENFYLKNEEHFRRTNFLADWQQILIRPSVHYKLNETVDFAVGYTYSKNFRNTHNFNENDLWEQVTLSHKSEKSSFSHRFRLEQRYIDQVIKSTNNSYAIGRTNFEMRFRYRYTWRMPLIKIKDTKSISIVAFDEIWLNTNKGIAPRTINQNWLYAGLYYPIIKNGALGLGYMNTYAPINNNSSNTNNILQLTLNYHL